jgi:hypothetical protein
MRRTAFAILSLWIAVQTAGASPVDDLASPDPGVRATAAETIRKLGLYHPTSRDRWDKLLSVSKKGDTIKATLEHLKAAGASVSSDEFVPADSDDGFRLDDFWMLEAFFHDGKLLSRRVVPSSRLVNVPPPPGYTGTWMVYTLNGTAVRLNYRNGVPIPSF